MTINFRQATTRQLYTIRYHDETARLSDRIEAEMELMRRSRKIPKIQFNQRKRTVYPR